MNEQSTTTTAAVEPVSKGSKKAALPPLRMNAAGKPVMHAKIYAPFKVYFDYDAESLTAENATGEFDILPHHKNFITLLSTCEIIVRNSGVEDFKLKLSRGIMHVKADEIRIFLDV